MSRIQDDVNKLLEQQRQVDFAESILGRKENDLEMLIEQQKQKDILSRSIIDRKDAEFKKFVAEQKNNIDSLRTQQEFKYENSLYYYQYQCLINNIDVQIINVYNEFINEYNYNIIYFGDAFYKEFNATRFISGIGYPVPEKYLRKLNDIIVEKLNNICTLDDVVFNVSLTPSEYLKGRDCHVAKLFNGYILKIELKRVNKKHKVLK